MSIGKKIQKELNTMTADILSKCISKLRCPCCNTKNLTMNTMCPHECLRCTKCGGLPSVNTTLLHN